jgi:EamA domain-containing membrane protein RarD
MNGTLLIGTIIVTIALICYSIAIITEQRKSVLSPFMLVFLTMGIILDVTATCFMIAGSRRIPLTFHGILGYSALTVMLVDTILIWKTWMRGALKPSRNLHLYTRFAYTWWVLAYFAGGFVAVVMVHSK